MTVEGARLFCHFPSFRIMTDPPDTYLNRFDLTCLGLNICGHAYMQSSPTYVFELTTVPLFQ